jgi:hypothetical protein
MIGGDAEKPKLTESAMMLDWNEYRKQLAAGVKEIGQLSLDAGLFHRIFRQIRTALAESPIMVMSGEPVRA